MQRQVFSMALAATLLAAGVASAQSTGDSRAFLHGYNLPASGVALEGYCPVCYFAANKAVKGTPDIASEYNGVTYHFVSQDARRAFEADPEKFLPAYGGWCAIGIANDKNFPVDPTNFKVVDGRLFLFLKNQNVDALAMWNQADERALISKADEVWSQR